MRSIMILKKWHCAMVLTWALTLLSGAVFAQGEEQYAEPEGEQMTIDEFLEALQPQSGSINLPGNIAIMELGEQFRYLSPNSTETLLVEGWGNPPGNDTLGMVIPANLNPMSDEGWGVVISYTNDGYVKDDDADDIDYDGLLSDLQEQSREENKERVAMGYGAMDLVGWAEAPTYDSQAHKLYWAKEFSSDGAMINSLNYNIRVLGRKGVLVLNAVAGMNQIDMIKTEMPTLVSVTEFTSGNRYEDFDSSTDHVAEYGLAALVAGGVAAKMGLFAKLFAFLLAFKKILIIGLIAAGVFIKQLFTKKAE